MARAVSPRAAAWRAAALATLLLGAAVGAAFAQATPVGLWKQVDDDTKAEKSLVRIVEQAGQLTGRVEKILDPARAEAVCEPCTGELHGKPVLGLQILQGVRRNASDPTVWDGGEILDPNNGKTYRVRLTPQDGGRTLGVRGYIGTPLLGRSQTWIRVE